MDQVNHHIAEIHRLQGTRAVSEVPPASTRPPSPMDVPSFPAPESSADAEADGWSGDQFEGGIREGF